MSFIWLALFGVLGVILRYGIWRSFQHVEVFPISTLIVNVFGSFLIGLVYSLSQHEQITWLTPGVYLGLSLGFLGALTTYSSFSLDTLRLFQMGYLGLAGLNVLLNNLLCLLFCYLGFKSSALFA